MKLPDFANSIDIQGLKKKMGLPANAAGNFSFEIEAGTANPELVRQLETDGYESSLEEIEVLEDGTLGIKDRRIVLYIRDKSYYGGPETLPRFHISNCRTLRQMWADNRFGRYVSYSKDTGIFLINFISGNSVRPSDRKLPVCQNCLDFLNYQGFSHGKENAFKRNFVSEFNLKRFFEEHPKSYHVDTPRFCFETAPLDVYSADFVQISHKLRENRGWKCEKPGCPTDLSSVRRKQHRRFLHVHHVNGQKYDNRLENLRCLCLRCHANEPHHGHLKKTSEYQLFMNILKTF